MQSSKRVFYICRQLVPAFSAYFSTLHDPQSAKAHRAQIAVRQSLQRLGPTFIKLGQLLSARPDMIGLELAAELRNLLDDEPVIPFGKIETAIEAELKQSIVKVFKKIEQTPLGTASIAQVHKGELNTGQAVAIKVRRPGIEQEIARDLPILRRVCKILEWVVPTKTVRFSYLYNEFADWITNELDFRVEGRRADTLRENMKAVEGIAIPRIYWAQSSEGLLVMSFVEGSTVNELLNIMHTQKADSLYATKLPEPVDPDVVIQRTVAAVAKQALIDRYFHGDLHPANIIIQKHSRVAFVDFGIIGTINAEEHAQILLTLVGLVQNSPETLVKVFKSLAATPLSQSDISFVHQQLSDELHRMQEDGSGRVSLNHFITVIFMLSQRYRLSFTQGFIIAMKTIAQIDSVAGQIGLQKPLVNYMRPEVEKCLAMSLSQELSKENLSMTILSLVEAGKQLPQTIDDLERLIHSNDLLLAPPADGVLARRAGIGPAGLMILAILALAALAVWLAPIAWRLTVLIGAAGLCLLALVVTILKAVRE